MADRRRAMMAKLHVARAELGLEEDAWRDLLEAATGNRSLREMADEDLARVLDRLRDKGWVARSPAGAGLAPVVRPMRQALLDKIEALLADKGAAQGRVVPWSYAEALCRRICKVDRMEWAGTDCLRKVVAALTYDRRRRP